MNGQIVTLFASWIAETHSDIDVNKVKALADRAAKIFIKSGGEEEEWIC